MNDSQGWPMSLSTIEKIKKGFDIFEKSGIKGVVRNLLAHYNVLNAIRFREPRMYFSCSIGSRQLPKSTNIVHPVGVVIHPKCDIGENVVIFQNVTIGRTDAGAPKICDDVRIFGGAMVVGDIRVGKGATVGANAVVIDDVPDGATVAGVPATKI